MTLENFRNFVSCHFYLIEKIENNYLIINSIKFVKNDKI